MFDISDSPIQSSKEDDYSLKPFADSIYSIIQNIQNPNGEVIAITGSWGSGKTSCINLIRELNANPKRSLLIDEFKCMWYHGEDPLALNFLQHLLIVLPQGNVQAKKLFKSFVRLAIKFSPIILSNTPLSTIPGLSSTVENFEQFLDETDSLENTYSNLLSELKKSSQHILIIIDDLDRLSAHEIIAFFKILHFLGKLPNITYLIAYDETIINPIFENKSSCADENFLEKIIQLTFPIPVPLENSLAKHLSSQLTTKFLINLTPSDISTIHDVILPIASTPRKIKRLLNAFYISKSLLKDNVFYMDVLILDALRLNQPLIFNALIQHRLLLSETNIDSLIAILKGLALNDNWFIQFQNYLLPSDIHYETIQDSLVAWRKIRIFENFETYLNNSLYTSYPSAQEIQELISNTGNSDYLANLFKEKTDVKFVELLTQLRAHIARIPTENIPTLVTSLLKNYNVILDILTSTVDLQKRFQYQYLELTFFSFITQQIRNIQGIDQREQLLNNICKDSFITTGIHILSLIKKEPLITDTISEKAFFNNCDILKNRILQAILNDSFLDTPDFRSIRIHASYLNLNIEHNIRDYLNQKLEDFSSFLLICDAFSNVTISGDQYLLSLEVDDPTPFDTDKFNSQLDKFEKQMQSEPYKKKLTEIRKRLSHFY